MLNNFYIFHYKSCVEIELTERIIVKIVYHDIFTKLYPNLKSAIHILRYQGDMARTCLTESLIRSEFQYFAIQTIFLKRNHVKNVKTIYIAYQ